MTSDDVRGGAARRWTPCPRCGREHWLADGEVPPAHATSDDDRVGRPCVGHDQDEGSEWR